MPNPGAALVAVLTELTDVLLAWGWLALLGLAFWIAWEVYLYIKHVDYLSAIRWTYLQVTVPEDSAQTPKSFENAIEVWGGIHKDPDLIELLFEGYFLPWFSCEIQCQRGNARYIIVVPTDHAKFMEGVIYGQYPTATVREVEDYTQTFTYQNIEKTFDMWGSEMNLAKDDYYPIRLYREFEDVFAEDDRFVDPHQALIEAFTNINEGEHFWIQILIKPMAADTIQAWADKGQEKIATLSGSAKQEKAGWLQNLTSFAFKVPGELLQAALSGPVEAEEAKKEEKKFKIYNPSEDAEMKGILQKVSRAGFKTKIRVMHFAPAGKLHKPNYGKAIGVFKQFNSFNLNSIKPDKASKTNGPNYLFKQSRRRYRKRKILVDFQQRDFWGDMSGDMMSAEEIATLYHFPIKYVRAPAIERATAGLGSPPSNLPYV